MSRRPDRVALIGVVAVTLLTGTAAFALWSASISGTGSGTTGTTTALTLTPGSVTGTLYPGGTAALSTVATNADRAPVRLAAISLDTARGAEGFAIDAGHPGCSTASFSFTPPADAGAGWTVPASSSTALSLPAAIAMSTAAPSACQGATVTVFLKAAGR